MRRTHVLVIVPLLVLLFLVTFMGGQVWAQDKGVKITFAWEQTNVEAPDFWGWKMWAGTTPGGPYDYVKDADGNPAPLFEVQYGGNPQATYSGEGQITAPANAETTFYFVVNAWDKNGNFSADSNEVSYTVDFVGPEAPVLSIEGVVIITPSP